MRPGPAAPPIMNGGSSNGGAPRKTTERRYSTGLVVPDREELSAVGLTVRIGSLAHAGAQRRYPDAAFGPAGQARTMPDDASPDLRGRVLTRFEVAVAGASDGAGEDQQFTLREGPCFEAYKSRVPVLISDVERPGSAVWLGLTRVNSSRRDRGVDRGPGTGDGDVRRDRRATGSSMDGGSGRAQAAPGMAGARGCCRRATVTPAFQPGALPPGGN
jgi:hypothetical protein